MMPGSGHSLCPVLAPGSSFWKGLRVMAGASTYQEQGDHALWKTGKMVKKNSLQGKIREFEILLKIREKSGNLKKSYLCKVKIFELYSCSDMATGGFLLPHAYNTCGSNLA